MGGALEDILTPLLDPAYRLGTLLLGDAEAAQSRVQDAVAEAKRSQRLPRSDRAAAWFLGLVYEDCRPGRAVGAGDAPPLVRAVGRLPAEDRAALFLHYWLHLTPADVAEATGIAGDEIASRLNLVDRFGLGVRPLDVADVFEDLTHSAPYGFERRMLAAAEPAPAARRDASPLAWTGIAALALAGLLLVILVGPTVDPAAAHKIAALAQPPAPSPTVQATAPPSSPPPPPAVAPSPTPTAVPAVASNCSVRVPSQPAGSQPVAISQVRVGTDSSRDRFVVQLDGPIPPFNLQPATGGWQLVINGASQSAGAPTDLKPGYPVLTEARYAGGAAGSVGWSLSISSASSCPVVSTLSGPSRIVIDFPHA